MFKFRLLVLLPLLTLALPLAATYYVTINQIENAKDDLEGHLKHVASLHLEPAKAALLEKEAKQTVFTATEMAKGSPFNRAPQPEGRGGRQKQAAETEAVAPGDPDLLKKLAAVNGGSPKNFAAVFDVGSRTLGEVPVDPNLVKACTETMVFRGAVNGRDGAALVLANGWAYLVGAAPITVNGATAAVFCFARRVDDNVARELKKAVGEDITLTLSSKLLGTTIRDNFAQLLPDIILKKPGTALHGEFAGRKAPFLIPVPLLLSSDAPTNIGATNGEISVTLTAPLEPELKDLRSRQLFWTLFSLLAFVASLGIAISVYVTVSRTVAVCTSCLETVSSGNLQVQVPTQKLSKPLSALGEAINHTIFSIRERGALFHPRKRQDLDELLGREEHEDVAEPAAAEVGPSAPAHAVSADLTREQEEAVDRALEEVQAVVLGTGTGGPQAGQPAAPAKSGGAADAPHVSLPNIQFQSVPPLKSVPPKSPPIDEDVGRVDDLSLPPVQSSVSFEAPDLPPTMAVQVSQKLLRSLVDEESLDGVFQEFIEMRKLCGERIDTVPRDRFLDKLKKTRADVIARTGCREVRFTVFSKDGKASVKAIPVK